MSAKPGSSQESRKEMRSRQESLKKQNTAKNSTEASPDVDHNEQSDKSQSDKFKKLGMQLQNDGKVSVFKASMQLEHDKKKLAENVEQDKAPMVGCNFAKIQGMETAKIAAYKKFIRLQTEKVMEKRMSVSIQRQNKIWDDEVADLALSRKRDSEIGREIGLRHVRIVLPTPESHNLVIKRRKPSPDRNIMSVKVLKSADPCSDVKTMCYAGPRCNKQGAILQHSILGDVDKFTAEAYKRGDFKDLLANTRPSRIPPVTPYIVSPRVRWNPLLNEDNALKYWDQEMINRRTEQRRLAGKLQREERDLLMCKSDGFTMKQQIKRSLHALIHTQDPSVCFWRLQDRQGDPYIIPTLTKSERGIVHTPVVSGDADTIYTMKGKQTGPFSSDFFKSEYVRETDERLGGVIQIANTVLFNKLELCVEPVSLQENSVTSLQSKEGNTSCDPVSRGDNRSCDISELCPPSGNISHQNNCLVLSPSLCIDGTTLSWYDPAVDKEPGWHSNMVAKETFTLIEADVNEIVKCTIPIENNGSTVVHYYWKRIPDYHPLPVPRPKRRPFYFMADAGMILPGQTIHAPLLFRSQIPGYFTEAWLLATVPLLVGGAKIRFTLKGVARGKLDYSKQCDEIEETLRQRQVLTMCDLEARFILDHAVRRAVYERDQIMCVEEPTLPGVEELFELKNHGMHYQPNVISRLQILYDTVAMETRTGAITPVVRGITPSQDTYNSILSVIQLKEMIQSLPSDDENDEEDGCVNFNRKQSLLWNLNEETNILSFRPFIPVRSQSHDRYVIIYTLLQAGVDRVVSIAQYLATKVGVAKTEDEEETEADGQSKDKKRKGANSKAKSKRVEKSAKGKQVKGQSPTDSVTPAQGPNQSPESTEVKVESLVFSTAARCRAEHKGKDTVVLSLYDEKVYVQMYCMLEDTVESMLDFFDN